MDRTHRDTSLKGTMCNGMGSRVGDLGPYVQWKHKDERRQSASGSMSGCLARSSCAFVLSGRLSVPSQAPRQHHRGAVVPAKSREIFS